MPVKRECRAYESAPTANSMRYARSITLLLLAILLLAVPAADARAPRPYVKSVTPLRASVGEQMTLQGFYFRKGYAENTVVFIAKDGRVSYVKSEHSTRKTLTVIVPQKVERLLNVDQNGTRVPTKFRVKVIARRMSRVSKSVLAQPTIGPDVGGDCDNDGNPNPTDNDDDNDLLPDSIELDIRTNPCVADSDGDRMQDGWEYLSALDLNTNALPYPGKKPYPNALYPDRDIDYDGDGLYAWTEHALWWAGGRKYPLDYSDGTQTSVNEPTGSDTWNDFDGDGFASDDERDFDNDGLANIYEFRAPDFQEWSPPFPGSIRPNMFEADTDGDGLLDGWDDQDHDDVSNIDELRAGTWPMNACDPGVSRTCPRWLDDTQIPKKPQHECISQTIRNGGFVKWLSSGDGAVSETAGYCLTYP